MTAARGPDVVTPELSTHPLLAITREFAWPPERLWQAWARADEMVRWLGPVDWPATDVKADVRVGGAWRARLAARDGTGVLWQSGRYLRVDPPTLLRFTFRWEGTNHEDGPGPETAVTVRFERLRGGRTRLTLTQEGLAGERSASGHARGWSSTLERLDTHLQTGGDHPCS